MSTNIEPAVVPELRYAVTRIRDVDFRDATATDDGSWTVSGYAAVFDQDTTLYDGKYFTVRESIAPGAFTNVLASSPAVHLNFGHDMNRVVASTDVATGEIGSLTLTQDEQGLRFLARVDRNDPDAQALAVKMSRGVIRQASFAFTVARDELTTTSEADGRETDYRRILEIKDLYDVCACAQGAYPQTSAVVRSHAAAMGHPDLGGPQHQPVVEGGAMVISPGSGGGLDESTARRLAALRAKARVAQHIHSKRK